MKKTIMLVILLIMSFTTIASAKVENNVKIFIDNQELNIPEGYGTPFIDSKNRTQIPLRIVSESLGFQVDWNPDEWSATINDNIVVTIGSDTITTKDGEVKMDTEAVMIDNRTFVPLRFVIETLNFEVGYKRVSGYDRIDIYSPFEADVEQVENEENNENGIVDKFANNEKVDKLKEKYGDKINVKTNLVTADKQGYKEMFASIQFSYYPLEDKYALTIDNLKGENGEMLKDLLPVANIPRELAEYFVNDWNSSSASTIVIDKWITYNDNVEYRVENRPIGAEIFFKVK